MDTYRNFLLWQKACDLAESIYRRTCRLPDVERTGLTAQLRQTALDIPCRIAASPTQPTSDFLLALTQIQGLLRRLEVQVLLADRLHYLPAVYTNELTRRIADVQRLLDAFFGTLQPQARFAGKLKVLASNRTRTQAPAGTRTRKE